MGKPLQTFGTLVRFLSTVQSFVFNQVMFVFESFVASVALVRALVCMIVKVSVVRTLLCKNLVTLIMRTLCGCQALVFLVRAAVKARVPEHR